MATNPLKPVFTAHTNVRMKHSPDEGGMILKTMSHPQGWQYYVQFSLNDKRWVHEEDLEPDVEKARSKSGQLLYGTHQDLLLHLLLTKLRDPLADVLYGLHASRTEFIVYQFKPAIKFLENPDQRLLIADEVGLGKTIEAGIIFRELQARTELNRVLVICPAALRYKWQSELLNRFQEDFSILDSQAFRKFMDDYDRDGDQVQLRGIISLESIRRADIAERIAERKYDFNLVIIDEAHHLRNRGTRANEIGVILTDLSDAMLLLTATPLQTGNQDLFQLLHILAPGDFDNYATFSDRIEPNKHINLASSHLGRGNNIAALQELLNLNKSGTGRHLTNNPNYTELINLLEEIGFSQEVPKEDLVRAQKMLLNLNTLSHIFTRTRKREVEASAPARRAFTLKVKFTEEEKTFYEAVIKYVKAEYMRHNGRIAGWATTTRERQAASSIQAMKNKYLNELAGDQIDVEERVLREEAYQYFEDEDYLPDAKVEGELVRAAHAIGDVDSKFDMFIERIQDLLKENPERKILVFSFFLHTLKYLKQRMDELGIPVFTISGSVPQEERNKILDAFQFGQETNILISSEVGSEGLDFQFCDCIVNYDLPWNPMKVEQRIGRLDRYGQKAKVINIFNLVIEDSIEDRIFLRLYDRIEIFKQTVGDLEAILGQEIQKIQRIVFSQELTKEEEEQVAENASQAIIRAKHEMEEFEKNKLQFMGQDAIFQERIEEKLKSGRFISQNEIRALVEKYTREVYKDKILQDNDDNGDTYALNVKPDLIEYYKKFMIRKKRSTSPVYQNFLRKLQYGNRTVPLTFSDQIASSRRPLEFIHLNHPLAEMAREYWLNQKFERLPMARLIFEAKMPQGEYYYFLYKYSIALGSRKNVNLQPVIVDGENYTIKEDLGDQFLPLLQGAPQANPELPDLNEVSFDRAHEVADFYAASLRHDLFTKWKRDNEIMIGARLFAIEQSFTHRNRSLDRQLEEATDERIQRMKKGQLRNNHENFLRKKEEIEKQKEVSVTYSLELAGQFFIRNGQTRPFPHKPI